MLEDIFGLHITEVSNLSEEQEQLVKATINRYTFEAMQEQLKRIDGVKKMSNETSFKVILK